VASKAIEKICADGSPQQMPNGCRICLYKKHWEFFQLLLPSHLDIDPSFAAGTKNVPSVSSWLPAVSKRGLPSLMSLYKPITKEKVDQKNTNAQGL